MEQITSSIGFFAATASVLVAAMIWNTPDMLRYCIMRLAMRVDYIEAGRKAARATRTQHEGALAHE